MKRSAKFSMCTKKALLLGLYRCLVVAFSFLLSGCSDSMFDETPQPSAVETQIGDLEHLISLARTPERIKWQNSNVKTNRGGANLMVLMQFNKEDYQYIVSNSQDLNTSKSLEVSKDFFNKWLKDNISDSQKIGDKGESVVLKELHVKKPTLFTSTKLSPFIHGDLILLGQGKMFLWLYTM